jgi:hypothetical protein
METQAGDRSRLDQTPRMAFAFPHDPTTTPDGEWCSRFVQSLPQRRLNPAFVEWLMGFPSGWLDARGETSSGRSETPSAPGAAS